MNIAFFTLENVNWCSQLLLVVFAGVALVTGTIVNKRQAKDIASLTDSVTAQEGKNLELQKAVEEQRQKTEEQRERAARSEKEVLELQQLIKAPRSINVERARQILCVGAKGAVSISYDGANNDALRLAGDMAALLASEGWDVKGVRSRIATGDIPIGVNIRVGKSWGSEGEQVRPDTLREPLKTLFDCLRFSLPDNPPIKLLVDPAQSSDVFDVMIGPKY